MNDHLKHLLKASVWTHGDSCGSREVISETLQKALFKTQVDAVKVVKEPARNRKVKSIPGVCFSKLDQNLTVRWSQIVIERRKKADWLRVFVPSFNLVLFLKLLQSADGAQRRQVARGCCRSAARDAEGAFGHQIVHHLSLLLHHPVRRWESWLTGNILNSAGRVQGLMKPGNGILSTPNSPWKRLWRVRVRGH